MNFKEYQVASRKTASYPGLGTSMEYPLLGLLGESGELSEKFKKVMRDNEGVMSQERIEGIIKECGDVLWYLFQIYTELKMDFQDHYEERNVNKDMFNSPLRLLVGISCCVSDISIFCLNSNKTIISELTNKSSSLISLIKEICKICSVTIEEVMDKNIEKLTSRMERDVIKGDGDSR